LYSGPGGGLDPPSGVGDAAYPIGLVITSVAFLK
jgi:hypothetical protein